MARPLNDHGGVLLDRFRFSEGWKAVESSVLSSNRTMGLWRLPCSQTDTTT